mgnify:FL=1|jgi:hypothetical protein|nr:MAG TPA_asm: hypothetical protein [Caudoviricetes sp.]
MTENIINNLQNFKSISPSDIRVLDAIKQITRKGDNAEVKQKNDGTLSVYAVKKSKQI